VNKTALALALAVGGAALLASPARAENAMYSCTDADGVVQLTNVPTGSQCEKLFSYAAPVAATPAQAPQAEVATVHRVGEVPAASSPAAAGGNAPATRPTPSASATPRNAAQAAQAQRREDAIQQTRDAYAAGQAFAGANPAVNRRYLMTNRSDYQKAIGANQ
jgi:hypothetical protein